VCGNWYLTLKEKPGLLMFENRMRMEILGPKRKQGTRVWRQFYNEDEFGTACCTYGTDKINKQFS